MDDKDERVEATGGNTEALKSRIRELESALATSEDRFDALVTGVQVGVVIQAPNAEIIFCNDLALELLGLTRDQMLGKTSMDPSWNVIHEDGSPFPGETHPVPVAIATRKPVRNVVMGVYRPVTKDRAWILVNAMPQLTPEGELVQVVCTFADISERVAAEEMVRRQAEMLAELSTPLIPISDKAVVVPLIGVVDERRAAQVIEILASGVTERRAELAILDMTGVPIVDMQAAQALMRAAAVVRLLGAKMVLTGVRPPVARMLVDLGVELGDITLLSTLQSGIAYAFEKTPG